MFNEKEKLQEIIRLSSEVYEINDLTFSWKNSRESAGVCDADAGQFI